MPQIRGAFRKIFIYYPLWGKNLALKHVFTPNFCLHTVTTGSGLLTFDCPLLTFHLLTEIYPMVPFPPSLGAVVSDYTSTPLRWTPLTRADAVYSLCHSSCGAVEGSTRARRPTCCRCAESQGADVPASVTYISACDGLSAVCHVLPDGVAEWSSSGEWGFIKGFIPTIAVGTTYVRP